VKRQGDVWCKNAHRLAWLDVDDSGAPGVAVAAVAPGHERLSFGVGRVPVAYLLDPADAPASETVMVGCPCKKRWQIDAVAVARDVKQEPRRVTGDDFPGVSFDR
jgi:hypothetical protein